MFEEIDKFFSATKIFGECNLPWNKQSKEGLSDATILTVVQRPELEAI